ncbi:MAG: hypothetical protein M3Y30_12255 [Gemmatimonadota bacterium]|nr:hypothetical protein [Gemmatimonadota bacterium]
MGAQTFATTPVHIGITGGLSLPTGDFNFATRIGWNAGAVLRISSGLEPLAFRFDGQWQHMNGEIAESPGGDAGAYTHFRLIDITANAEYTLGFIIPPSELYLIAGAGAYFGHTHSEDFDHTADFSKVGLNFGIGEKLEKLDERGPIPFLELRYHYILHGSELLNDVTSRNKPLNLFLLSVGFVF